MILMPNFYRTEFDATQELNLVYVSSFFGRRAGGISGLVVWCSLESLGVGVQFLQGVSFRVSLV